MREGNEMIPALITICMAFAWLLYETDYMRVRLLAGEPRVKYARYEVFNILKSRKTRWGDTPLHTGGNMPEGYKWNGEPCYNIILHPGIKDVLCGCLMVILYLTPPIAISTFGW